MKVTVAELEQQLADYKKCIDEAERMCHHLEDDNAHLTQKVNGLQLRVDKVLRWGRSMRDYAHKYHKQVKEMEQRIEELEAPNSCDGCKYGIYESKVKYVTVLDETLECCFVCTRACDDYYEPKDK